LFIHIRLNGYDGEVWGQSRIVFHHISRCSEELQISNYKFHDDDDASPISVQRLARILTRQKFRVKKLSKDADVNDNDNARLQLQLQMTTMMTTKSCGLKAMRKGSLERFVDTP
jgi:hypothetical protein